MRSMKNRKGYKKTKLGWIPDEWDCVRLQEISKISRGKFTPRPRNDPKFFGGSVPFVQTGDVTNSNGIISSYSQTLNEEGVKVSKVFPKGTILITIAANIGYTGILTSDMACTDSVVGINCTSEMSNTFLNYFLISFRERLEYIAPSGAQKNINIAFLQPLRVPKPSISEQKKIAIILSTWDKAIDKLSALIDAKEEQKKGLMQRLISQRMNEVEHSRNIRFKQIFKPKKVKAGDSNYEVLSVTKSGIVLQSEYFKKKIASKDTSPYLVVNKGEMVMSGLNFWMGAVDILTIRDVGIVSPAYKVFEIRNEFIDRGFMNHFVKSKTLLKALIGSSVQGASIVRRNLDKEMLMNWKFSLPSKSEQNKIANLLDTADNELNKLYLKKENLQVQKKGLMQQLLTGKTRVKIK